MDCCIVKYVNHWGVDGKHIAYEEYYDKKMKKITERNVWAA